MQASTVFEFKNQNLPDTCLEQFPAYLRRPDRAITDSTTEDWLIQAARAGDLSAFNRLVMLHQDSVYRWVLSLVKDEALAEDITQAAFITAYEKIKTFRDGSFRAWLFTIARNRFYDEFRRTKRNPIVSLDASFDDEDDRYLLPLIPDGSLLPEDLLVKAEQAEKLAGVLEQLPEPYRQVLQLIDMEEFDYQDAANLLHLPLGTLKSRLVRARRKFRSLFLELLSS